MQTPKVETIRTTLLAVLGTVRTLSADNTQQPLDVMPISRFGNTSADLACCVEQGPDECLDGSSADAACLQDTYHQEFLVLVNIQEPPASPDFDTRLNTIVADVRKAVMASFDSGTLKTCVDVMWAHGLTMKGHTPFNTDGGVMGGVIIPFLARYTTLMNDPYQ